MTKGRHVALLRGINVGGRNRLAMKELTAIFEEVGCRDVRTYIQSGNVVYAADEKVAKRVPAEVSALIAESLGLSVPVVTRTAARFLGVAEGHPFASSGAEASHLSVAFLATRPAKKLVLEIDELRSPPDEVSVRGSEIYLHCPGGSARSKFTAVYFDRCLRTVSTFRNWKTVGRIAEMLGT